MSGEGGRVAGKVALVTGAARGIGRACALRLASEGADAALLDIGHSVETVPYPAARSDQLEATASDIRRLGRRAITLRADVRNGPAVRASVDEAIQHLGRIHILVTAAGIDSWND